MYQTLGDTGIDSYYFFNDASLWLAFFFNLFILGFKGKKLGRCSEFVISSLNGHKRTENKFFRLCLTIGEVYLISFAQFYLGALNGIFGQLVGTGDNYYGTLFVSPIMVALFSLLLGRDIFKLMDTITLTYPLKLILVKLACFCCGCCEGVECSFGLYNHLTGQVEFPTQLLEMALAAVIFVFLMLYKKRIKEGTMYPIYLIIYSATRFFSEFTRGEENTFLFLKTYHILCLTGIAVGVLLLFVVKKYKERICRFYNDYFDAAEDILNQISVRMGLKRENQIVHRKNKKKAKRVPTLNRDKKVRVSNMKRWIIIWTLGLIGQVGWNIEGTWINTFVYDKISKTPSVLTPMLIMSAIGTTVSIFIFGTLTDRTGKRRSMISTGFVIWGILIACFGLTQYIVKSNFLIAVIYMVIMDMLLSFFGSMSTDVGYSTWLTDIMNDKNRGQIGGAIAIQTVLGSLLGNIIGGYVIGEQNNYLRLFILMGTMLSFLGMVSTLLFDKKDDVSPIIKGSFWKQLASIFNFRTLIKNKALMFIHLAVAIYYIGYNVYFPHLGNFLIDYLGYSASQTGLIKAVPLVFSMLATIPVSKFINKNKYTELSFISSIACIAGGSCVFSISPSDINSDRTFNFWIFLGVFLVGVSYIIMLQSTKTWTKTLYPKEAKGQFEGLWALAFVLIPNLFGSNIGELVIKKTSDALLSPDVQRYEYIPNGKVFLIGTIISAFSIIPLVMADVILKRKALEREKSCNS